MELHSFTAHNSNMKAFSAAIAAAAVAGASAEAFHPFVGYAAHPATVSYGGLVAHPNGAVTPDYTPAQKAVAAHHFALKYGKREAEAEPYYGYGYGLPYFGYGKSAPCVNAANVPVPCAHLGKREADPQVLLGGYAGLPYAGYGAALPYAVAAPVVTSVKVPTLKTEKVPCVNDAGEAVDCALGPVDAKAVKYSVDLVEHQLGKRSADSEAEADPLLYFAAPYGHRYGFPHNVYGQELIHSSNLGICTNYLGAQVPC